MNFQKSVEPSISREVPLWKWKRNNDFQIQKLREIYCPIRNVEVQWEGKLYRSEIWIYIKNKECQRRNKWRSLKWLKKSINISPTTEICYMNYCKWLCPSATELGRVKRVLPCGPRFLVRTQRRIWGLTCGKNKFIEERTERTPQGRAGLSQERHWCQNDEEWGFLKTRLLHIHLDGRGLTVLIDSCKLHNNRLYCPCLSHNSVYHNQMYVCIEYLWTFNGLLAA